MKPERMSSILLVGGQDTNICSFLFQCAMHWADCGRKVLYLSASPCSQLPPGIHGMPNTTPAMLSHITFMYLPRWQDLLKQMYSIHEYSRIPQVILVEGLEHYCDNSDTNRTGEKHDTDVHSCLVCASLVDAASSCAAASDSDCVLVASLQHTTTHWERHSILIDLFFTDTVWFIGRHHDTNNKGDVIAVESMVSPAHLKRTKVEFVPVTSDGTLILQKILHMSQLPR